MPKFRVAENGFLNSHCAGEYKPRQPQKERAFITPPGMFRKDTRWLKLSGPDEACFLPPTRIRNVMPNHFKVRVLQRLTPLFAAFATLLLAFQNPTNAGELFLEAEGFTAAGGWTVDTQFIQEMGSPYLLAHGLGKPVEPASTTATVPEDGKYRVWVRTKDWVRRWKVAGTPGRFRLAINGNELPAEFGTVGANWHWHNGGVVELKAGRAEFKLLDQTGFDGRCDAIYLTTELDATPDNSASVMSPWRRQKLNLPEQPATKGPYDLVVIGGGYSGLGAAISAARMGCKVALIHDRFVLGGNGSSEVRVWSMGLIRRGRYPRIGEIVEEFCDHATKSPGREEEFGDQLKEQIVRAEKNIDLFMGHHAFKVDKQGDSIEAVWAFDVREATPVRFAGKLFADCTGHAWIGAWANADWDMTPEGRMGMSNMWRWSEGEKPSTFPKTPWALSLSMEDFPYPREYHGQWFWESGFDKDPLQDAEGIRDWNLRAVYGAFNAMKNGDGAAEHKNANLEWVAYIGGPRESRRLMGDVILTQDDIVGKKDFPDGCVPSTWSIDLHYPKKEFADKFSDNPFISIAEHDRRIDRDYGYPIPYRCFYSRNIPNLFMAGRCISVTHEALGTTRVMKTCGMMGEVVGKAASICVKENCLPRAVYEKHLTTLTEMLTLPGKARRETVTAKIEIPADALPLAGSYGPPEGVDPAKLPGIVVDDRDAKYVGNWTEGSGLKGFIAYGYRYAGAGASNTATFTLKVKDAGNYKLRVAYQPHENRSAAAPVKLSGPKLDKEYQVNLQKTPPEDGTWLTLDTVTLAAGAEVSVILTGAAQGNVHADAVQLLPVK